MTCNPESYLTFLLSFFRENIAAQVSILLTRADSEKLARGIAEEQLSDVEKEKTMLELEIKELMARHKNDMSKKEALIASVGCCPFAFFPPFPQRVLLVTVAPHLAALSRTILVGTC